MLKYSDFVEKYLLNEGGPGSGPQPKDGGTKTDGNTEKQKSEGEKKETTNTERVSVPTFKPNEKIDKRIDKLIKKGEMTEEQKENFKKNNLSDPHPLTGYKHLLSGGLKGGKDGSDDIRVIYDKEGNVLDIGPHKKVYSDDNLKRLNKNVKDRIEKEKKEEKNTKKCNK